MSVNKIPESKQGKSKRENSHLRKDATIDIETFMETRVIRKITVYEKRASKVRRYYHLLSVTGIVCASLVPILINVEEIDALFPTVLSLIVTILIAVENLFRFREHWRNYDSITATLRSEQLQFQCRAGEYKDCKSYDAAANKFVSRIEKAIREERADTINMRTTDTDSLGGEEKT